jgi:hypothetical protein
MRLQEFSSDYFYIIALAYHYSKLPPMPQMTRSYPQKSGHDVQHQISLY